MAKTAVSQWDAVAANNTDINSIPIDGAVTTPSQVDNIVREMMAQVAVQLGDMGVKGADIASATTTNLANATGWYLDITGTTTITGFGTVNAGQIYMLRFTGALTLTYNASSLILPGAASITTAAGDVAFMMSLGSGNWRCLVYQRASGLAGDVTLTGTQTLTNKTITTPTLTLKQSAAPVPTAEGDVQWDTDDNVLAIGDGAATKLFLPIPASTAAGDIEYYTAAKVTARLAKGTAAQVLQMNAGATAPEWAAPISNHQGAAKAWVNFNGTGTIAIRDSYNVTSITDNGAGRYAVNFTTAMANADYAALVTVSRGVSNNDILANLQWDGVYSTTSVAIGVQNASNPTTATGADAAIVNVAVFGD